MKALFLFDKMEAFVVPVSLLIQAEIVKANNLMDEDHITIQRYKNKLKKSQKNIKDKINKIGQKILKKNIDEINLILDKV